MDSEGRPLYDRVCVDHDPDRCSQPIFEGQPAPFDGQLLMVELAIVLGQRANTCDKLVELEVQRVRREGQVSIELEQRRAEIQKTLADQQLAAERVRRVEAEKRPVLERPAVLITLTATLTAATLIGMWWASVETMKALDPSPAP